LRHGKQTLPQYVPDATPHVLALWRSIATRSTALCIIGDQD
jgi:hypothetical protein